MAEYDRFKNKLCPVCRAPFTENADIVVCPECGTPHHRVCYLTRGSCALEELHGKGFVWSGRLPDEPEPQKPAQPVSERHAEYPEGVPSISEEELLEALDEDNPFREFINGVSDKALGEDGVSMHELSAYSATSIFHYGRAFRSFRGMTDGKKHMLFFNACSGLFAPVFQFYRKMDFFGVIVLIVMTLPSALMTLTAMGGETSGVSDGAYLLYNIFNIAVMVALCIFGDYIYYRHAVKRIRKIREDFKDKPTSDEYYMALYESGKPSFARAALGLLAMMFMEACVIALPYILTGAGT
ncbi:MAG: hypothetical protein NC299_11630 [Lachnospiraceae bacterium]|nr:hypothetical protein [Ruminococcus sp.]MCM1275992.1 hypothetical protein [Lachnospiraceae bacterium]